MYAQPIPCWTNSEHSIQKNVGTKLQEGVVEPTQSQESSLVVLIPEPEGSWQFCINYGRLNAITSRDIYPNPKMDDCVDFLCEATWFSALDTNSGHWQVPIAVENRDETTITFRSGTYSFQCMPFGFTIEHATFRLSLDILHNGFNWQMFLMYYDDAIAFSKSFEAHLKGLEVAISTRREAGGSFNLKKCCFLTDSLKYVGHIIKPDLLTKDKSHAKSLSQLWHPRNVAELRSFLGLGNLCRRFVFKYADIAPPQTISFFEWGNRKTCQNWTIVDGKFLINSICPSHQSQC